MSDPGAGLLLRGGDLLDVSTGRWRREDLVLRDGRVLRRGSADTDTPPGAQVLDVTGLLVAPGLVDAQVNGAHGVDITSTPERVGEVAGRLTRYGVTAFAPTVITSAPGTVERVLAALRDHAAAAGPGARMVGVHAEGPFLAEARRGAHPVRHLRAPKEAAVAGWTRDAGLVAVTLAPELPGALDVVRRLTDRGVVVSVGHTGATYRLARSAVGAGARALTHLFNAMPPFGHRDPGPIGVCLGDGDLVATVIVDGVHVHPAAVRTAWRALGPERFALVSDATAALGLPPGETRVGDQDVVLGADGSVRLAGDPTVLAGSGVGLDDCVRTLVTVTGCTPAQALTAATLTPARLLRRDDLGRLDVGCAADVTVWDTDLRLRGVIVGGVPVSG